MADFSLQVYPERWRHANAYSLSCGQETLLFDPALPLKEAPDLHPTILLSTHNHYDHIHTFPEWKAAHQVPFYSPEKDRALLQDSDANCSSLFLTPECYPEADRYLADAELLELGDDYALRVIATPGHSPGSSCYLFFRRTNGREEPLLIFTGDTIFSNCVGRSDLPMSDPAALAQSLVLLTELFLQLPEDLPVLPGHGPASTVGRCLCENPWLRPERQPLVDD